MPLWKYFNDFDKDLRAIHWPSKVAFGRNLSLASAASDYSTVLLSAVSPSSCLACGFRKERQERAMFDAAVREADSIKTGFKGGDPL